MFISLGSDRLLTEYILGKSLIENGFRQISFLLVDPGYLFSEQENLKVIKEVLKDFRERITSVYLNTFQEHFPQESIHYLSRSQNIAKYFPSHANVAVIESLPPYAEIIKEMKKFQVEEKKPDDLLCGGYITPSKHANAVAFIPAQYTKQLSKSGATLTGALPLAIFKSVQSKSYWYLDWGCKIHSDGTYRLSFSGEEQYWESLRISKDSQIKLTTGEEVQAKQFIPIVRDSIEKALSEQLKNITKGNSEKKLSQEDLTALLEKVKETIMVYMPGISCFFSADYLLDRNAAITFIASQASQHYRKTFSLIPDLNTGYRITIDKI